MGKGCLGRCGWRVEIKNGTGGKGEKVAGPFLCSIRSAQPTSFLKCDIHT